MWDDALSRWDAFLVFAVKQLGLKVDDPQVRDDLLALLLESRHRLVDALSNPAPSGADPVRLCEAVNNPPSALADPDLRIRSDAFAALLDLTARQTGMDDLGLRMGGKTGTGPRGSGNACDGWFASLVSDLFVSHNLMMAICLIALTPSVILVLLLRRFVVEGFSAGAMKG